MSKEINDLDAPIEAALEAAPDDQLTTHRVEDPLYRPSFLPDYASYAKRAADATITSANSEALWRVICRFGTDNDFFSYGILWWLRRVADWLLGGPSFRRRRQDPEWFRVGDLVDAWQVIGLQPQCKLTLLLEMKLPGAGVLEFEIIPRGVNREVRATAYFEPAGVWGLLYWYPLVPFHHLVFGGMTREIARRALCLDAE